jgi:hypothetical protein
MAAKIACRLSTMARQLRFALQSRHHIDPEGSRARHAPSRAEPRTMKVICQILNAPIVLCVWYPMS